MKGFCIFVFALLVVAATGSKIQMEPRREAGTPSSWIETSLQGNNGAASLNKAEEFITLTFALKLSLSMSELDQQLMRVSSPSSKDYGKLMSYQEMRKLTAPSDEAEKAVLRLLFSFGAKETKVSNGFIQTTVPVSVAEELLHTEYKTFAHTVSGEKILRCAEYFLPEDVAEHVAFVAPTVNFPQALKVQQQQQQQQQQQKLLRSEGAAVELYQNTPDSLRALYGVDDVMGGKADARQAVTAFLGQYYLESDLQSFYQDYFPDLLGTPIAKVVGPDGDQAGVEASLDVEYMTTLGAGVATEFWSYAGRQPDNPQNEPFLDWLVELSDSEDPPLVFSTSYGEDEVSVSYDYAERMNEEFARNALRGITFLFASGDSGVGSAFGSCTTFTPQYPSDSPYVTAVGATTAVAPETGAALSSGGFSNRWARPDWQDEAVATYFATAAAAATLPDAALYNASGRGFPDVSAQGTNYVVVNGGATLPSVAGTSCSSPTFGGIVALLNDARIAAGKSPLGFLNPFIYANPGVFTDVTAGNNPGCGTKGFEAAAGWDPITGYGTPSYPKMLQAALALP